MLSHPKAKPSAIPTHQVLYYSPILITQIVKVQVQQHAFGSPHLIPLSKPALLNAYALILDSNLTAPFNRLSHSANLSSLAQLSFAQSTPSIFQSAASISLILALRFHSAPLNQGQLCQKRPNLVQNSSPRLGPLKF